jgi:hypothetical protein
VRKRDKFVYNVQDLIKKLKKDTNGFNAPLWYRGQSRRDWKLSPSFLRWNNAPSEMNLIKKFKQSATMLLNPRPVSAFDWLFIMQHHGVPTRLLDWTESPLVAAFFAVDANENNDGVIWVLLPVELNKKSRIKPDYSYDIPSFEDEVMQTYSPESLAGETTSQLYPIAAIAPRNNPRMQSQLSVFTISHRDKTPIEEIEDKQHMWRYIIPKKNKKHFRDELKLLGISKFQLFPELPSIGEILRGE